MQWHAHRATVTKKEKQEGAVKADASDWAMLRAVGIHVARSFAHLDLRGMLRLMMAHSVWVQPPNPLPDCSSHQSDLTPLQLSSG